MKTRLCFLFSYLRFNYSFIFDNSCIQNFKPIFNKKNKEEPTKDTQYLLSNKIIKNNYLEETSRDMEYFLYLIDNSNKTIKNNYLEETSRDMEYFLYLMDNSNKTIKNNYLEETSRDMNYLTEEYLIYLNRIKNKNTTKNQ
jgi:hypothetical protein